MVEIHLAKESDFSFYYEIKKNKDNIYWSGHSSEPVRDTLYNFYKNTVENQSAPLGRKIYIIWNDRQKCGYLYLDPIDSKTASVSVAVLDRYAGKGIGRMGVKKLVEIAYDTGYNNILAEIREDNLRSQKLFNSIGFKWNDNYKTTLIENLGKEIKMLQYTLNL